MKSMQRKFGGLKKRSADEADVSVVLNEFKQADEMLDRLIKDLTAWRDSWQYILKMQYETADAFATLYRPITTADDAETNHVPVETPQQYLQKCLGLHQLYTETRDDLAKEVGMITDKLVHRAESAKLHAKLLKKTIKHRENMKLDFERYLAKVEHGRNQELRSQKDEIKMAKQEADLAQAKINYQTADDHVKENFPGVTDAIYALVPHLLTNMVMLQTTLVGQLYTVLDAYTRYQKMPNPAPDDAQIISTWESEFTGLRKELESGLKIVAGGKTVHMGMALPEQKQSSMARLMGRRPPPPDPPLAQPNRSPRPSMQAIEYVEEPAPPKPPRPGGSPGLTPTGQGDKPRAPSFNGSAYPQDKPRAPSYGGPPPSYDSKPSSLTPQWQQQRRSFSEQQSSGGASPPSRYATPPNGSSPMLSSASNAAPDYFSSRRTSNSSSIASAAAAIGAAKKKPAPPVPVKRIASHTAQFVTALYDFEAQSTGDLPFNEGDRIRVIKKTDSTDDWWTGELRGVTGSFPANYVQL